MNVCSYSFSWEVAQGAADPLVVASDPLRDAATFLCTAADHTENYIAECVPSVAAGSKDADASQLKATIIRLPSASQLRACADQLSAAAGVIPGSDADPLRKSLTSAADELRRV